MNNLVRWFIGRPSKTEIERARVVRQLSYGWTTTPNDLKEKGYPDFMEARQILARERAFSDLLNNWQYEPRAQDALHFCWDEAKKTWKRRWEDHLTKLTSAR